MSRWKVRREWRDTLESYSWVAIWPSGLSGDVFFTWREAMAYADRMARTVTVELPRIRTSGDPVPGALDLLLGWENPYWAGKHTAWIADRSSDAILVRPYELKPLALALLALAEQGTRA